MEQRIMLDMIFELFEAFLMKLRYFDVFIFKSILTWNLCTCGIMRKIDVHPIPKKANKKASDGR